jgi:hypothetical protein
MTILFVSELLDDCAAAVDAARMTCTDRRWLNAIETGWSWLLEQDTVQYDFDSHALTVNSPSGETYFANGSCGCRAFETSRACWHRAAGRIVTRALERQRAAARSARSADALTAILECF